MLGSARASETLENKCFFAYLQNEQHAGSGHHLYPEDQN